MHVQRMHCRHDVCHVNNTERFHSFRSWSQLEDESKGGYLSGFVKVPDKVLKIELALYTKEGNPHPNLLFVTPHFKKMNEKPNTMKAEDYKITLVLDEHGELVNGKF